MFDDESLTESLTHSPTHFCRSCGCFDVGEKAFKLLSSKRRSRFSLSEEQRRKKYPGWSMAPGFLPPTVIDLAQE